MNPRETRPGKGEENERKEKKKKSYSTCRNEEELRKQNAKAGKSELQNSRRRYLWRQKTKNWQRSSLSNKLENQMPGIPINSTEFHPAVRAN